MEHFSRFNSTASPAVGKLLKQFPRCERVRSPGSSRGVNERSRDVRNISGRSLEKHGLLEAANCVMRIAG